MSSVQPEIDRLVARRADIWAGREEAPLGEVERISAQLAALYDERRREQARDRTGRDRAQIIYRARVESELERLMTR